MSILRTENLSKYYQQGEIDVKAVKDCNIEIQQGEFAAVIGASGSGKSTLLNLCGGLDRPNRGKVYFCGLDLYANNEERLAEIRRKEIGFIFQNYQLVPILTAYENIVMPTLFDGKKPNRAQVEELADMLGITERLHHFPSQLSGGQQQRVAIARALINKPSLILADEPTGNLDKKTAQEVLKLLTDVVRQYKSTLVLITHEMFIAQNADRIFQMEDGVVTETAPGSI